MDGMSEEFCHYHSRYIFWREIYEGIWRSKKREASGKFVTNFAFAWRASEDLFLFLIFG